MVIWPQNELYKAFFDNQIVGMVAVDIGGKYLHVNECWCRMVGYSSEELLMMEFTSLTHPDDISKQTLLDQELIDGKRTSYRIKKRYVCKSGEVFWGDLSVTNLYDEHGILIGMTGLILDITEQEIAKTQLEETEELQRTLLDASPDIICFKDGAGRWLLANQADLKLFQLEGVDYQGKTDVELASHSHFYSAAFKNCEKTDELAWNSGGISIVEETIPTPDAGDKVYEVIKRPLFYSDGRRKAFVVLGRDITARKKIEEQLQRLAAAVEQTGETIVITDTEGNIEYVNPAFTAVTGYSREEVLGENPRILNSGEQDKKTYEELWRTISSGKIWRGKFINLTRDGSRFVEDVNISPITNPSGKIVNYVAVKRDITEQLKIEEQYRHSQKMEVIGQLAAGVTHDFNNMLAVILSQIEMILLKTPHDDPVRQRLHEIKSVANRSSELIQQLFGLARKQPSCSKTIDLNDEISKILLLLKGLIGKNIELQWRPSKNLFRASIDPGHLSQILTNLIINARDAISGSGMITVEVSSSVLDETFFVGYSESCPGRYIRLGIRDNGSGMDHETIQKIFDPFFTTKEAGKGTGLGLPMVFGLVRQNNGYIKVDSTLKQGTSFQLYFPQTQ